MADSFTIDVDSSAVLRSMDRLGDAAEKHCKEAARVTAGHVQSGAQARVRRATGQTAAAITVDEADPPLGGFRVYVARMPGRPANLPVWLETGTRYMTAQPFLFNSARLEEGAHIRRVAQAVEDAIVEAGLGE